VALKEAFMRTWSLVLLCAAAGCIARSDAKKPAKPAANPGIDETAIDPSVNPCDDFYTYACGGWLKRTEIPADRGLWVRSFSEIDERNKVVLRKILDDLAAGKKSEDPYGDKLGAFYGACMDEEKIEKNADAQLGELLKNVDAIKDVPSLAKEVAREHLGIANPLFNFHSQQDFKDASLVIATVDQGGLGLPDRDYYLKDDAKFKEIRSKYEKHVATMLGFAGSKEPAKDAATVMRIERALAEASMSRVDRRDPKKIYHRLDLAGLEKTTPRFPWKSYLTDMGVPNAMQMNVAVPAYFTALNDLLPKIPLADWKTYLRWHLIRGAAPALSKRYVDENFNFTGKILQGTDQILPRWKRCVDMTDRVMGEALARPFVRLTFGAEGKAETQAAVKNVEAAMEANLKALTWMDEPTRTKAFEKLHAIMNKIGYPDKWRNYDALTVDRDSYLTSLWHAADFESKRDLDKIGKPVDRTEWGMSPPTVNAYYDPSLNEMVFPAGILQSPFYTRGAPTPVNYGAIGMVMGHELTHGFDDEGRQFDAKGNLTDWWSPSVSKEFDQRAQCVVDQYNDYTVYDQHLNGKLTLGENIADLGGMKLAHAAYVAQRKSKTPMKMGKFTDEQLFFLGTAQAWCGKRREATARMRVTTDPHSPPEYRVNGPMSNLPEFSAAFQCKPDAKMVRKTQCVVW
jgi:endothelin-converting enzyme/putative endopeptidase